MSIDHNDFACNAVNCKYVYVVGASFIGYDDPASNNSSTNAADSSAASFEPTAAPSAPAAATGPDVTAGS